MLQVLEQLEVDPAEIAPLVEETSPIYTEALMHLLAVGKLIGAIAEAAKKDAVAAGCSTMAQTSLPEYMATFAQVKGQNPSPGIPITESHMYFLFHLYGYFPQTANLRLHFNTRKFLGFIGEYDAITFARDIFIVDDAKLWPKPGGSDFESELIMSTIIHEVRHSQQYRSAGWSVPAFGIKYLYQYCQAGFNYRTLQWEREAYDQDKLMNGLRSDEAGFRFFRY
ncbi:MAG: hypothetical protein Q9219_007224 [cf. Caloplaca sp. 3 TL-2023]